jgi:YVTN family beta-propeller protein
MALAQQAPYLVLQKGASSLAWYTTDGKMLHTVDVGRHPHELVFSKDGQRLFTTDNGTMRIEHAGTGGNTVSVIDLTARKRVAQISTGEFRRPHGIDVHPITGHIAVSTELPDRLLIIDPAKGAVIRDYDTKGKTSHMVSFGPKGEYAYVSNSSSGNVAAIRLSDGNVKLIQTGTRPEDSVLSADGRELYVCNRESGTLTVIDTSKNEAVAQIQTGKGPVRADLTPDGKTLVVGLMHDRAVGFVDVAARRQVAAVPISGTPVSLNLSNDGKLAFASSEDTDEIFIVSVPDRKIVRTIKTKAGAHPDPVVEARSR